MKYKARQLIPCNNKRYRVKVGAVVQRFISNNDVLVVGVFKYGDVFSAFDFPGNDLEALVDSDLISTVEPENLSAQFTRLHLHYAQSLSKTVTRTSEGNFSSNSVIKLLELLDSWFGRSVEDEYDRVISNPFEDQATLGSLLNMSREILSNNFSALKRAKHIHYGRPFNSIFLKSQDFYGENGLLAKYHIEPMIREAFLYS